MNIYIDSTTIHKKNCGNTFLKFSIARHPKYFLHLFVWTISNVLYHLHIYDKKTYLVKKWSLLSRISNIKEDVATFQLYYKKGLYSWFTEKEHHEVTLIDENTPEFLLESLFDDVVQIYGLSIDDKGNFVSQLEISDIWKDEWNNAAVYVNDKYYKKYEKYATVHVVCGKICTDTKSYRNCKLYHLATDAFMICAFSGILLMMTLFFATVHIRVDIIINIIKDPVLLILNYLPIAFLLILLYSIFGSSLASMISGATIIFVLSMINYFKLLYRDEPFVISDILLAKEAGDMAGKYAIVFHSKQWLTIFILIVVFFFIHHFYRQARQGKKMRLTIAICDVVIFYCLFQGIYQDQSIYSVHANLSIINRWSSTQNYQVRGFLYPLLYSYSYAVEREPENYDPNAAKAVLKSYEYQDMDDAKKANVIGIMLESYNDFSRYTDLANDPYHNFHEIQKESISGNFVSNIFAGGTVASERSFLNGYKNHPRYLYNTNSFVRYFKEQGYYTEALHPCYGWFYNRRNINTYLGFDNFYYIENYFGKIEKDHVLFQEIIDGYERNKSREIPYFNMTVTYQNHGPYSSGSLTDTTYLIRNDMIEDDPYYTMNNYLSGIADTDLAMKELFDYFRAEKEPVIIIMFGDHNPLLGDGNSGYLQNGMSLDLGTVDGFLEYYEIPYVIWANDAAKEMYDLPFEGEGDRFSAMYFLPYLFRYLGLEGNEYMQYLNDLYDKIPVMNDNYYFINNEWKKELKEDELNTFNEFINLEYYYAHNLWEHSQE